MELERNEQHRSRWQEFAGESNTPDVLTRKAKLLKHLVESTSTLGVTLALPITKREASASEAAMASMSMKALLLEMIEVMALQCLTEEQHEQLAKLVADELLEGHSADETNLFLEKHNLFASYKLWLPKAGESYKNTLLWEAAKDQANILAVGKNAAFNCVFANLLLRQLERWEIRALLVDADFA